MDQLKKWTAATQQF